MRQGREVCAVFGSLIDVPRTEVAGMFLGPYGCVWTKPSTICTMAYRSMFSGREMSDGGGSHASQPVD